MVHSSWKRKQKENFFKFALRLYHHKTVVSLNFNCAFAGVSSLLLGAIFAALTTAFVHSTFWQAFAYYTVSTLVYVSLLYGGNYYANKNKFLSKRELTKTLVVLEALRWPGALLNPVLVFVFQHLLQNLGPFGRWAVAGFLSLIITRTIHTTLCYKAGLFKRDAQSRVS